MAADVGQNGVSAADQSVGGDNSAIVNKAPPRWYEAWLRTEFSSLALIICLAWIIAFIAEQKWAVVPGDGLQPDSYTNTALGALDGYSVSRGQWWRFFTNPFLHGGPNHLKWDVLALLGVGPTFQALVGRAWFGATFAIVALASGAASLLTSPAYPGTVGPMGVVMGILAANFVCGFHFKENIIRARIWQASGFSLLVALYDTFRHQEFPVDTGGHIGGMIAGLLLGYGLLLLWPQDKPQPRFKPSARIVSWIFILGTVVGFGSTARLYPSYAQKISQSIPMTELHEHLSEALIRSKEYVTRYPTDPWAHHLRGQYFLSRQDYVNAESEFRTALRLTRDSPFGPTYEDTEQAMLAFALWSQGRAREAKEAAAPICHSANPDQHFRRLLTELRIGRICEE